MSETLLTKVVLSPKEKSLWKLRRQSHKAETKMTPDECKTALPSQKTNGQRHCLHCFEAIFEAPKKRTSGAFLTIVAKTKWDILNKILVEIPAKFVTTN